MAIWSTRARKNKFDKSVFFPFRELCILRINSDFYKARLGHLHIKSILVFEVQFCMADFPLEYPNGRWFIFLVTLCFSGVYVSCSWKCCCIKNPVMTFTCWHYSQQQDLVLLFFMTLFASLLSPASPCWWNCKKSDCLRAQFCSSQRQCFSPVVYVNTTKEKCQPNNPE